MKDSEKILLGLGILLVILLLCKCMKNSHSETFDISNSDVLTLFREKCMPPDGIIKRENKYYCCQAMNDYLEYSHQDKIEKCFDSCPKTGGAVRDNCTVHCRALESEPVRRMRCM